MKDKMNLLEKTGILSGFDPQNKLVTLSFILKTFMAAYARVNNRIDNDNVKFFSTIGKNETVIRVLLPENATRVMSWSIGYIPRHVEGLSDRLTMDLKSKRITPDTLPVTSSVAAASSNVTPSVAAGTSEATRPSDAQNTRIYSITLEPSQTRPEGNYHFFVIYYEVEGKPFNGYVSCFQEDVTSNDTMNYQELRSTYIKYLTSGNRNLGEFFTVFKRNKEGIEVLRKIKNASINTPPLNRSYTSNSNGMSNTSIDDVILPIVNVVERKDRRGNITVTHEIAYASDLNEQCQLLFRYIIAIHSSNLLNLPMAAHNDVNWSLFVRDVVKDEDPFAVTPFKPLIGIFTHEARNGRHSDRIVMSHSNMSRLIFGTDGKWLLRIINQEIRFKSPGNGSLLQILLGQCSEEAKITMICSSLAHEVDGIYNDLLGKSTMELEDTMIEDANLVRSLSDTSFSYTHLTGIDISIAYKTNYSELFRLLARLRSGASDYFVQILQPPSNYTGNMKKQSQEVSRTSDSTKLMSMFDEPKFRTIIRDKQTGSILATARIEGGLFLTLKRNPETSMGNNVMSPFSKEMKELNQIYNLFGRSSSIFTPLGFNANQLVSLNQHSPLTIRFLSDGTPLPQQAKPFFRNPELISKLPDANGKAISYILNEAFIDKLESFVVSNGEWRFCCMLAKLLAKPALQDVTREYKNIYDLFDEPSRALLFDRRKAEDRITSHYEGLEMRLQRAQELSPRCYINVIALLGDEGKRIFDEDNATRISRMMLNETFSPLERVNGFLLCCDWRKQNITHASESFHKHLAICASVFYAANHIDTLKASPEDTSSEDSDDTSSDASDTSAIPMCNTDVTSSGARPALTGRSGSNRTFIDTEAIFPNFGIIPYIQLDNGDVLIRTLNGSLSQRTNALALILASKDWSYVVGNVPRVGHSINTQKQFFEVKDYRRDVNATSSIREVIQSVTSNAATGVTERKLTFTEMFREVMSKSSPDNFTRKPEKRNVMMSILNREWKSLMNLPLYRGSERNNHMSFNEFHDLIQIGTKPSFVIDGKVYYTKEYRNAAVEDFLNSL